MTPRAHSAAPVILREWTNLVSLFPLLFLSLSLSFPLFLGLFPHRAACSLSSLTQRGPTGARGGVFNGDRRGRGHPASQLRDLNAGSLSLREKKKGWITATTQRDDRPYRRAGSPACTARVCRFSHRRTATAASPSPPLRRPRLPSAPVGVPRQPPPPPPPAAFYSGRARPPPKKLTSEPHLAPLRGAPRSRVPRWAAQSASPRSLAPPEDPWGPGTFAPRPSDAEDEGQG